MLNYFLYFAGVGYFLPLLFGIFGFFEILKQDDVKFSDARPSDMIFFFALLSWPITLCVLFALYIRQEWIRK